MCIPFLRLTFTLISLNRFVLGLSLVKLDQVHERSFIEATLLILSRDISFLWPMIRTVRLKMRGEPFLNILHFVMLRYHGFS